MPRLINEEFFPVLVPAATPAPVVASLSAAFQTAVRQSASRLTETAGVTPRPGYETAAQIMGLVRENVDYMTGVLRAAGVQPE